VGQEPILFNSTVRENILYGMEKAGNATGQGEIAGVWHGIWWTHNIEKPYATYTSLEMPTT
jgi:ABC-type transport system involved in cytochrome bd biosynthesis fused ATPase/permease subunit